MEKAQKRATEFSSTEKEEINWAEYLDYTRFFEPGEVNNSSMELFIKGCEEPKK